MGNFGGKQLSDGYSEGLVYDRIVEYNQTYDGSGTKTKFVPYGYDKQSTANAGYRTNDLSSGLEATRYLSENPNNLPFNIANLAGPQRMPSVGSNSTSTAITRYLPPDIATTVTVTRTATGVIDPDELKWYLPAGNQTMGYWINLHQDETIASNTLTTTEYSKTDVLWATNSSLMSWSKSSERSLLRCVRNVPRQKSSQQVEVVTDTRGNRYAATKPPGSTKH